MAETEIPKSETTAPVAAETNISPDEASKVLMTGIAILQRAWLQAAVNIGQALSKQQAVSHGAFDDLRRIREQVEELGRANTAISRLAQAQVQMKADVNTKN